MESKEKSSTHTVSLLDVKEVTVKQVVTKTTLPMGGWTANPYVGCPHACKYCYACFMNRFTGHTQPWGSYVDVKTWPVIKNAHRYDGQNIFISSVTDPYNWLEEKYRRTRALLEQLQTSTAHVTVCTKSDLVLRDLDLLKKFKHMTVSFSVNTLDEAFKVDMDRAVSIRRRLDAMKKLHEAGIRTMCFISPIFPGITDVKAIIEETHEYADKYLVENLNLRGSYKGTIMAYISEKHPELLQLYRDIYSRGKKDYWIALDKEIEEYCKGKGFPYITNSFSKEPSKKGHPYVVNAFYHEDIKLK